MSVERMGCVCGPFDQWNKSLVLPGIPHPVLGVLFQYDLLGHEYGELLQIE